MRATLSLSRLILLAAFVVVTGTAQASSISFSSGTTILKWKESNIPYHLNSAGSKDISNGSDLQAVHDSFTDWTSLSCGNLSAYHAGDTTANSTILTGANTNNKNDLTWVDTSAWQYGQYVLGITSPVFNPNSGAILEADIAFNGYLLTWTTTNTFGGKTDVKSIALHEIGHWFGIQHNLHADTFSSDAPTMVPSWNGTTAARTLEQDDINAFCFLYPVSGTYPCSVDNDCPYVVGGSGNNEGYVGQYGCSGGTCVWGSGGNSGGGGNTGGANSCEGKCGAPYNQSLPCQCDSGCSQYNDCCGDYESVCGGGSSEGGGTNPEGGGTNPEGGGNGGPGGSASGPVYECLLDYCVSDYCFNFEICIDVVACMGDCNDSVCGQGCVNAAPGVAQQVLGTLVSCAESNGCFELGSGGTTAEGGNNGETGSESVSPEGGGTTNNGYDCPGFFDCAGGCSDQACYDACSNNTDPAIFSTVSNAFICLQNNGCMDEPTYELEQICATAYCLDQMNACYGADFVPTYPNTGDESGGGTGGTTEGGGTVDGGGANTGDEGIVGEDGDKDGFEGGGELNPYGDNNTGGINTPGSLTISDEDDGGCQQSQGGLAPLWTLLLMMMVLGGLRRKAAKEY